MSQSVSPASQNKNTLCCLLQNRLGALDRFLGALTHRGFLPSAFTSRIDQTNHRLQVMVTFDCEDEQTLEKLVKALYKQVYVLEIRQWFEQEMPTPSAMSTAAKVSASRPELAAVSA